ncbi:hypothetical protein CL1_0158 [Thermococcus cleftensis]|uniref:Integral membrane protein n=1 Tax=Thermococcus cleftensis (strain DSM 27260 / KACC 17922 / CL1) TaxID=163003 RepID=I3ZRN9_THECF|nr:DUF92 domain-containing protein [Thermococcus cleftensis]AFL94373.1 hypothetical protein CL1_0158 [Thermococcus cleftensis]
MLERIAMDVAVAAGLGFGSYHFKALDAKGAVAATALGLVVIELGGLYPFLAMVTFVILGVLATKYRFREKTQLGAAQDKNGIRSWGNVLGNGLAAAIFLIFEHFSNMDVFWAAVFAAIATANGDTLASELGKVFGKSPKLITNLKPAKPGTNGAVSWAGELFAFAGALAIALFALPLTAEKATMLLAVTLGGFIGVNIDSLIGATLENEGITDNNSTNFLASLMGGFIGAGLFYALA